MCKPVCKPKITMSTTVNVLCYKSKVLKNGENPLMLCISKDRKRKYQSLGVSVNPIFWDFEKNKPKVNKGHKTSSTKTNTFNKHFNALILNKIDLQKLPDKKKRIVHKFNFAYILV